MHHSKVKKIPVQVNGRTETSLFVIEGTSPTEIANLALVRCADLIGSLYEDDYDILVYEDRIVNIMLRGTTWHIEKL